VQKRYCPPDRIKKLYPPQFIRLLRNLVWRCLEQTPSQSPKTLLLMSVRHELSRYDFVSDVFKVIKSCLKKSFAHDFSNT